MISLTDRQFRVYVSLVGLLKKDRPRIIRPYFEYAERAVKTFPKISRKEARLNYRGYVRQLIQKGILTRLAEGVYLLNQIDVENREYFGPTTKKATAAVGFSRQFDRYDRDKAIEIVSGLIHEVQERLNRDNEVMGELQELLGVITGSK